MRRVRRGGAPLFRSASCLLPLCLFTHSNGLASAPRDGEQRSRPVSVRFRPFRDSPGPPHGQRACSGERVPGCSSAASSERLFVPRTWRIAAL